MLVQDQLHPVYTLINDKSNLNRLRFILDHLTGEETDLERFFQLAPGMFCIADKEGYFKKLNYSWTANLGWDIEELLPPRKFLEFVHPDDLAKTIAIMEAMENNSVTRFINRYKHKDGSYVALDWFCTLWVDGCTYASARPVSVACLDCPRFPLLHQEHPHARALALAGLCDDCPHRTSSPLEGSENACSKAN